MDNNRLQGKTAAITGGASGIGKEIANLFSKHGAKIALIDLNEENLNAVKSEIGNNVEVLPANITNEENVKDTFAQIESKFGGLNILVNCAGIYTEGNVTNTTYENWRKILDVNLNGAFLCGKYAIDLMIKTNSQGSIVNISSECGINALESQVAYNVSKAALISLSNCMAVDYALNNIRVNCVCPGRVLTPLVQHIIDTSPNPKETFDKLSHDRPMMRMGSPVDIANACLHFADDSMPYATGAVLSVDGGATAR